MSFKKLTKRSLTSEMERNVKQMLKLIEEDGDSFAQKAEMYYQKRPELISLVEEFYRGYKSLAERYDHDFQSQASCLSENGSEPPSTWPSPSPRKMGMRRVSSNRAAGFDFFLGSSGGGNNNGYYDACQKDGDGSSTLTDSDDESDASSIHSYNSGYFGGGGGGGGDHGMNRRIIELEMELRGVKEKLCMHDEEHGGSSNNKGTRMMESNNGEDVRVKINAYEQALRNVNEKLRLSEEEIAKLKVEVEKYRSLELVNLHAGVESPSSEDGIKIERGEELDLKRLEKESNMSSLLEEELRITKGKLESSEMQIASLRFEASKSSETIQQLQDQLYLALKDIASWKAKFNSEKRESTKLQEKIVRLKTSLAERDNEIRDLKTAASNAELAIFFEKAQLKSEMSRFLEAQTHLDDKIKEWECHSQSLEEENRKIQSEKLEIEETLKGQIEILNEDIKERNNNIKGLNASLDALKSDRDNLNVEVGALKEVVISKDNQIVNLLEENERQRAEILEGAEEKREAIRQLCFSLEHYRNGYNVLRQAFMGYKRFPVVAS